MLKLSFVTLILITLLGCTPQRQFQKLSEEEVVFQSEKTSCMGTCPVFTFTVYTNGVVIYRGREHTEMQGTYLGKLSKLQIQDLQELSTADAVRSYKAAKKNALIMDLPTTYYKIKIDSEMKTIKRYGDYPEAFKKLDSKVKSFIETVKWKPLDEEKTH